MFYYRLTFLSYCTELPDPGMPQLNWRSRDLCRYNRKNVPKDQVVYQSVYILQRRYLLPRLHMLPTQQHLQTELRSRSLHCVGDHAAPRFCNEFVNSLSNKCVMRGLYQFCRTWFLLLVHAVSCLQPVLIIASPLLS